MPEYQMKREQYFVSNGVTIIFSHYPEGIGELLAYTKDEKKNLIGYTTFTDMVEEMGYTQAFGVNGISNDIVIMYLYQKFVGSCKDEFLSYAGKWDDMKPEEQEFHFHTFKEFIAEMEGNSKHSSEKFSIGS